jgi:hypothetical protein
LFLWLFIIIIIIIIIIIFSSSPSSAYYYFPFKFFFEIIEQNQSLDGLDFFLPVFSKIIIIIISFWSEQKPTLSSA